jgi:hypothetical protein
LFSGCPHLERRCISATLVAKNSFRGERTSFISLAVLSIYSSPPEAQRNCDATRTMRPSSTYRAEVENGSDNYAVILPDIAVLLGDLDQIRMCCIPI